MQIFLFFFIRIMKFIILQKSDSELSSDLRGYTQPPRSFSNRLKGLGLLTGYSLIRRLFFMNRLL